jgi:hypothetical protein
VRDLVTRGTFDVFVNLCDGSRDQDVAGVEVIEALAKHGAAYTGSDAAHYEPSKIDMKILAGYAGLNVRGSKIVFICSFIRSLAKVPGYCVARQQDDIQKLAAHLRFPVIVKHVSGFERAHTLSLCLCGTMHVRTGCLTLVVQ